MKLAPGVFPDHYGLRAFKRTKLHGLETKRFKADELEQAKRWREEVAARAVLKLPKPEQTKPVSTAGPTLAEDAPRYLDAIQGMPTIADRTRHIKAWVAVLGDKPRASITSVNARQRLEEWRVVSQFESGDGGLVG